MDKLASVKLVTLARVTVDKLAQVSVVKLCGVAVDKLARGKKDKLAGVTVYKLAGVTVDKLAGVTVDKLVGDTSTFTWKLRELFREFWWSVMVGGGGVDVMQELLDRNLVIIVDIIMDNLDIQVAFVI